MKPRHLMTAIAMEMMAMAVSCTDAGDAYLRTLGLEAERLEAADSINVDNFDLFQARGIVALDNGWLVLSAVRGEYNLLFLNPETGEHVFAFRRGRGPGEILSGCSLHGYRDGAVFYDLYDATCINVRLDAATGNISGDTGIPDISVDTVGVFADGPSKPVFLTSCGEGGFVSGNLADDGVWYSYYDKRGNIISEVEALRLNAYSLKGDYMISRMINSAYASDIAGTRVCVANMDSPSLSFSKVESGILTEYRRYSNEPSGMVSGRVTEDFRTAFSGIDADDRYVYVLYSGHKIKDDVLPANECVDLIVYDWDGNPVRHYVLDRNVNSIDVSGGCMWAASTYPESCAYRFVLDLP